MEKWKDIKDYEGLYQVSNLGNVKSLERKNWMHRNKCYRVFKEKRLTPQKNSMGYLHIGLNKEGKRKIRTVHQ